MAPRGLGSSTLNFLQEISPTKSIKATHPDYPDHYLLEALRSEWASAAAGLRLPAFSAVAASLLPLPWPAVLRFEPYWFASAASPHKPAVR
jgi:hypothetical protein